MYKLIGIVFHYENYGIIQHHLYYILHNYLIHFEAWAKYIMYKNLFGPMVCHMSLSKALILRYTHDNNYNTGKMYNNSFTRNKVEYIHSNSFTYKSIAT